MLPANGPVLRALSLPAEYAITRASELGEKVFFSRLEARLQSGLKLVQVREKELGRGELKGLARRVLELARAHGAKVLLNSDVDLAREIGADGVHLTAAQLEGRSSLVRRVVSFARGAAPRRGARGRSCGARPGPRDALAPGRGPARLGSVPGGRGRGIDTGVCPGRRPAARPGTGPKLRRARPRHGAGRLGRLVRLFRLGLVLVFLERNAVPLHRPIAQVDELATLGAKRAIAVLRQPRHLRAAARTAHETGLRHRASLTEAGFRGSAARLHQLVSRG